jgi:hypothetical protein
MCIAQNLFAQKKTPRKPATGTVKFKMPKLQTLLGDSKDSVINIPVSEAERLVGMPLKIYDDKKNEYSISSYQFLYKRKVVTEDEKTGKISNANSILSNLFKTTPLPDLWVKTIRQQVKAGEELYFFDIIVKDSQGRVMYAPSLKILIP